MCKNEFSTKEIINALEICVKYAPGDCEKCPIYHKCSTNPDALAVEALRVVNKLRAENMMLKLEINKWKSAVGNRMKEGKE